jgi:hypothetical protein
MSDRFRWNAEQKVWEFNEPAWGGWMTLRSGVHVSSRPMTFKEGARYVADREPSVLREKALSFEVQELIADEMEKLRDHGEDLICTLEAIIEGGTLDDQNESSPR